jgi:hypothetical protein
MIARNWRTLMMTRYLRSFLRPRYTRPAMTVAEHKEIGRRFKDFQEALEPLLAGRRQVRHPVTVLAWRLFRTLTRLMVMLEDEFIDEHPGESVSGVYPETRG